MRALKHAMIQQIDVSIGEYFNKGQGDSKVVLGQKTKLKVAKNKIAAPFKTANLDLYYDYGLDRVNEVILVAKEIGVLQGTSWLKFIDPRTGEIQMDDEGAEIKWNGLGKAKDALNQDIAQNEAKIYNRLFEIVNGVIRGEA